MSCSAGEFLLDFCNPNNTIVFVCREDFDDLELDYAELIKQYDVARFSVYMISSSDYTEVFFSFLQKVLCELKEDTILNIIYISKLPIPSLFSQFFLVISPFDHNDCYNVNEQCLYSIAIEWAKYSYISFKTDFPEYLRGTDGYDTFTGESLRDRIPKSVFQVMNSIPNLSEQARTRFTEFALSIQNNRTVPAMKSANDELSLLFKVQCNRAIRMHHSWHSIPWWFAENYEFFCLNRIHKETRTEDQSEDPFYYLKQKGLTSAFPLYEQLVKPVLNEVKHSSCLTLEILERMLLCVLWSNQADLSMSGGRINETSASDFSKNNKLLINETSHLWELFQKKKDFRHISVFADNTGMEILCDFVLITTLLHYYPQLTIHYIIKSDPVFISDVTLFDIDPSLKILETSNDPNIVWMGTLLRQAHKEKRLLFEPVRFLSTALSGWEMPLSLVKLLQQQDFVVTKGDANYRRLVGDRHWPYDTEKEVVLNYYPCPIMMLRTLKSNVNIGVSKEKQEEAKQFHSSWDVSGKVGVIQFFSPHHSSVSF